MLQSQNHNLLHILIWSPVKIDSESPSFYVIHGLQIVFPIALLKRLHCAILYACLSPSLQLVTSVTRFALLCLHTYCPFTIWFWQMEAMKLIKVFCLQPWNIILYVTDWAWTLSSSFTCAKYQPLAQIFSSSCCLKYLPITDNMPLSCHAWSQAYFSIDEFFSLVLIDVWNLQDVIERSKPDVILVELHPGLMAELGYEGGALKLLQGIYSKGFEHVSHSGYVSPLLPLQERGQVYCKRKTKTIWPLCT